MADEAVCIIAPKVIRSRTVATATPIPKGTILYFSADPNTAAASSAADQSFAGITIEEFTGGEGKTTVSAAMDGVWDIKDSGAGATLGTAVAIGGANLFVTADAADLLNGAFLGYLQETAAASEVCRVELRGY
ncbi:MAG: hypothetical protein M0R35_07085 [Candidatus Omnitrophica bacterium]|nr:hypothetical protein [Candidatus Omnitrophota bacterium]